MKCVFKFQLIVHYKKPEVVGRMMKMLCYTLAIALYSGGLFLCQKHGLAT
jgi:hypothetical protein